MIKTAENLKALADPTRLRIVSLLRHGELCVCDLMESLQLPQSTISRHLSFLKNAGWVSASRDGKWMHYKLLAQLPPLQTRIAQALTEELPHNQVCQEDDLRYVAYLAVKSPHSCD